MSETIVKTTNPLVDAPVYVPKKLSEAIRIGAKIRPKTMCNLFSRGGSCAIGAALEGVGHPYDERLGAGLSAQEQAILFSGELGVGTDVIVRVIKKNDIEELTREEIADWLEKQGL